MWGGDKISSIKYREMKEIPIDKIDIDYRLRSDVKKKVNRLKKSIKSIGGLVQPTVVFQKDGGRYGLIVGTRRLEAYKGLGREKIPALIIDPVDAVTSRVISLIENVRRLDPPIEDIRVACSDLAQKLVEEENVSYDEIVSEVQERIATTKSTAKKYLSLTMMPEEVQEMVAKGQLDKSDAYRVYCSTDDESQMIEIAELVKEGKLTREQQDVLPEVIEKKEKAGEKITVETLPKETREMTQKSLKLWLPFDEYDRLEEASKDLNVDVEGILRIAVLDWLGNRGY